MTKEFYAFDTTSALNYINSHPIRAQFFDKNDELTCTDLADGNVNLVFRVQVKNNPKKSIIVKQALPFARRYPEFKMPLERARIEVDILKQQASADPGRVPTVYHFDTELFVNVMEDLRDYHIMREGIMKQKLYPNLSKEVGLFLARTLFYSSDLYLDSAEKKARVPQFINSVLCKVTEDLVYTFPFAPHETNRFPSQLKSQVEAIYSDVELQKNVARCRLDFMTKAECLTHGDLHTGSIMVNEKETKVMDPEFGFYGPFAFDIGMLLANFAIGSFAQSAHVTDEKAKTTYQQFLQTAAKETWNTCLEEVLKLIAEKAKPEWKGKPFIDGFIKDLERDITKHMGCEMIRRTIGMAHVLELDEIKDEKLLVAVSSEILTMAQQLLHDNITTVKVALELMESK